MQEQPPSERRRARTSSLGSSCTAASALAAVAAGADEADSGSERRRQLSKEPPWLCTALSYVAFGELGALVGLTGPAVPHLATQLGGRKETEFGAAFTCRGGGYMVGSVLASMLCSHGSGGKVAVGSAGSGSTRMTVLLLRRLGARPSMVMGLALLLAAGATAGVVRAGTWGGFLAVMVVQGLGLGALWLRHVVPCQFGGPSIFADRQLYFRRPHQGWSTSWATPSSSRRGRATAGRNPSCR